MILNIDFKIYLGHDAYHTIVKTSKKTLLYYSTPNIHKSSDLYKAISMRCKLYETFYEVSLQILFFLNLYLFESSLILIFKSSLILIFV